MIRALELSVPASEALAFSNARLRVTWDDREQPSIDAPVALFFGAGILYNRDDREYLVKAFPSVIQYRGRPCPPALVLPDAVLPLGATIELVGAGRQRRSTTSASPCATRRSPIRPTTSATSTPPTAIIPRPRSARTWCCSTPRRRKAAATGRAASSAPPTPSPTTPCSTRSRAIRASSSTTARRRRRKAPAARSGAAAATTGAGAP